MDFIPDKSEIQIANIDFKDPVVKELIRELGIKQLVNQHRPDRKSKNWEEKLIPWQMEQKIPY